MRSASVRPSVFQLSGPWTTGSTADLARYFTSGLNRIVISHVDDCCSISRIADVTVTADGDVVGACR